ncbi:hypothetical protein FWG76_02215 [Candidatus Saccharibacteria bacterium]|nr:hypothetical protein [Candidatus Saccharibacteria bacterium]
MDNQDAVRMGGLWNKPQFLGAALAEITASTSPFGTWNNDHAHSVYSDDPWAARGDHSPQGAGGGVFAFVSRGLGGQHHTISHRTILLGY